MKKIRCVLALLLLAGTAHAGAPTQRIQAMLAKPEQLCGRFDQTKRLAGMKKPLASNGRFCVVTGKGILWRTLAPFPATVRLTRDEIVQLQGTRVAMRLDAQHEPTVRMINGVLFSLLAGDLGQLDSLFEADGAIANGAWKVKLTARAPALARAIGTITLEGDAYVRSILIEEAGGDRTEIGLSAIETGPNAIMAEEAAQF